MTTTLTYASAVKEPLITREEEKDYIRRWQENEDEEALAKILRSHARMAWSTALRYSKNPEHVKDLVSVGMMGLMTAASRYDLERTNRFATYAQFWVLTHITNALSSVSIVIDVPSRTLTDVRRGRYKGLDRDRAHMAVFGGVNLDAPIGSDSEESSMTAMDLLECPRPQPHEAAENASESDYYKEVLEKAFADLTERERSIIVMRKLSEEQKTLEEISDMIGVTRERVRQIEYKAMGKLKKRLQKLGFSISALR